MAFLNANNDESTEIGPSSLKYQEIVIQHTSSLFKFGEGGSKLFKINPPYLGCPGSSRIVVKNKTNLCQFPSQGDGVFESPQNDLPCGLV